MKRDMKKAVKIAKCTVKAVKIISTCIVIAATVYSLIPKQDTIEGIDTDKLIYDHSSKA